MTGAKKIRAISVDIALLPHLGDVITTLTSDWVWELVQDDVDVIVAACKGIVEEWYGDMLVGSVFAWIVTPPAGWLLLDGSTHASTDYPELSAILPAHLISGANFILPDVLGAHPHGVEDEDNAATVTGTNILNLTVGQLPGHTHTYTPPVMTVSAEAPVIPIPTAGIGTPVATGQAGSGDDIDKRPLRFGLLYAVYAGRE